jgi:hypothetical protein
MNGARNRKLLFILSPVTGLVMFAGVVLIATFLTNREYREPYRAPAATVDVTPRVDGLAAERAAAEAAARAKLYVEAEYRTFPIVGSRVAIWAVAQLHLLFAAFVLAVPLFALIIEVIGYKTGDLRYDRLAHEFTKLLSVSFSLTATFGAFLTFMLIALYPKFTNYLMSVFSPTFLPYVLLFFAEAFFLYAYYYGWGKFHPLVHLGLGLGLNLVGTAIMFIANAWLTFMMSPSGVSDTRSTTLRGCRSTSIESSPTSRSADRWRLPTPPSSSSRRNPTRTARTTTGWVTSGTSSPSVPSFRFPSPATGSRVRSTPTHRRWDSR